MSQYHHLTILERERIFLLHEEVFLLEKSATTFIVARLPFHVN